MANRKERKLFQVEKMCDFTKFYKIFWKQKAIESKTIEKSKVN